MHKVFKSVDEQQMDAFEQEAIGKYDEKTVKTSLRQWGQYSDQQKQVILNEGNQIYIELVEAMALGAESIRVQTLIRRWRHHLSFFWTPKIDQLQGLADTYHQDARFKANFDALHPELSEFMGRAVKVYVRRHTID